jgi:acetyl esterase/lipase
MKFLSKKIIGLFIIVSIILFFKNKIILSYNLTKQLININESLSTVSCNFNENPIDDITFKDVVYKTREDYKLTLDIYSPYKEPKNGSPVILYVFGNSWMYGGKSIPTDLSPIIGVLREEGYTIISTSYELVDDKVIFAKQISDIKDTIRWIHKNKDLYNFNADEIGVIAPSAGAQLSMVAAFSDNNSFIDDTDLMKYPSTVKYIIDLFGPADLSSINLSKAPASIIQELSILDINKLSKDYSPINFIKENIPDTLIIHSKIDEIVPYDTSVYLYQKALEYKNNFELYTLNTSNHYLDNLSEKEALKLYLKIVNYIISKSPI